MHPTTSLVSGCCAFAKELPLEAPCELLPSDTVERERAVKQVLEHHRVRVAALDQVLHFGHEQRERHVLTAAVEPQCAEERRPLRPQRHRGVRTERLRDEEAARERRPLGVDLPRGLEQVLPQYEPACCAT